MLDPFFRDIIAKTQANWRIAVCTAVEHGVATPAFSAALGYYDSYRQDRLPRICSRRSATTSARTPTSASTNPPASSSTRVD